VQCAAITSAAPGTSRRTRRIAAINWVTVSWVATAPRRPGSWNSAPAASSRAAPGLGDHRFHRVDNPGGSADPASRRRQSVNVVG